MPLAPDEGVWQCPQAKAGSHGLPGRSEMDDKAFLDPRLFPMEGRG